MVQQTLYPATDPIGTDQIYFVGHRPVEEKKSRICHN